MKDLVLGRQSSPDVKNKDVTVSAWARAQFKSGDGTFKITVKTFYQVHYFVITIVILVIRE